MNTFKEFLRSGLRNSWITSGTYGIYVRRGHHSVNGQITSCFDLANVINTDEEARGKGQFWTLVKDMQDAIKDEPFIDGIFVESVQNPQLCESLAKRGFSPVERSLPPSFYLPKNHECK